jgi:predicted outer membrane repeat protein
MKITTLLLTLATASLLLNAEVQASEIVVQNTNDSGAGSLRQAILDANASPGVDLIRFASGLAGQISLTNGQLLITGDVTIEGPGADVLAVDAGQLSRVLFVQASAVTIRGLTLRNGRCPVGDAGGGIRVLDHASLTLEECAITSNTVPELARFPRGGGGVYVSGSSTFVARRCLFADNVVEFSAGGAVLLRFHATATLENCTFAGNKSGRGGAIYQAESAQLTMESCTVTANTSFNGGGTATAGSPLPTLRNCIFAGNAAPWGPDVLGAVASQGYNLIGNTNDSWGWVATDLLNTDPLLGDLADNGGPTMTCALLFGSPALNAITNCTVATDQRGVARPQGPACDIGAFEYTNSAPEVACATPSVFDCAPPKGVLAKEEVTVTDPDNGQTLTLVLKQDDQVLDTQTVSTPVNNHPVAFKEVALLPGSHPLTVEVSDGLATVSCDSTVTVNTDETAPTFSRVPANISVEATSAAGATVKYPAATASDLCGATVVTYSKNSETVFPIGKTTVLCTATDAVGNQSTASFTVTVAYPWSGVLQPINQDGSSVFQLGSTKSVKFQLTGACASIKNLAAKFSFLKLPGSASGKVNESTSNAKASTGNLFRYDSSSGQYIFNWSTKGLSSGLYQLEIALGDGVMHTVKVSLN